MNLTVIGSKSFQALDGMAWSCTLYIDGKKAAYVIQEGNGGPAYFQWYDKTLEQQFEAYVKTLPLFEGVAQDGEMVVGGLLDKLDSEKRIKRWCKTKTVVTFSDSKPGEVSTFNRPYSPEMKDLLQKNYGNKIVKIHNEDYL